MPRIARFVIAIGALAAVPGFGMSDARVRIPVTNYHLAVNDGGEAAAIDSGVEDMIERPAPREKPVRPPVAKAEKPLTRSARFLRALRRACGLSETVAPRSQPQPLK